MAGNYKIWAVGEPLLAGSSPMRHIGVAGVAKSASRELPHLVANELICARLAQALLLPIPPGFLVQKEKEAWFVSLNFNLSGEDLPPVSPSRLATEMPDLATGIILFDLWISNLDRHRGNLAFDAETERLQIFDHGSALFIGGPEGLDHIHQSRKQFGVHQHCLVPHLQDDAYLEKWARRIRELPEWLITGTFDETCKDAALITEQMATVGSTFLLERRDRLMSLLTTNASKFTAMKWSPLAPRSSSDEE